MKFGSAATKWAMGVFCAAAILSGCIGTPPAPNLQPAPQNVAPPLVVSAISQPYQLQVGDVMDIKIMLNPELNDQVVVRPDGKISTTLADDVQAAGRTVSEVEQDIAQRYSTQLTNPHIAILVRSFAPSRVYVTGEVNTPGEFITVGPNLTLLQSIARAGGLKNSADPTKIIIIRKENNEKSAVYSANYTDAASGFDPSSDVRLAPYDVVFVPRSDVGNAYLYFQQYLQEFMPASLGLGYQLNHDSVVNR